MKGLRDFWLVLGLFVGGWLCDLRNASLAIITTLLILLSTSITATATPDSTTFSTWQQPLSALPVDTGLQHFQNYQPSHQPSRLFGQFLGNLGNAHFPLVFHPDLTNQFDIGMHQYDQYLLRADSTKFYNTKVPYTDLFLLIGNKKEVMVKATHAQNLRKNFYLSADFQRHNSQGTYSNQKGFSNSVGLAARWRTWWNLGLLLR